MINAIACAKVNLSLRVGRRVVNGRHEVSGLFQSIGWCDQLTIAWAEADTITTPTGGEVIAGHDNLAMRAIVAVRTRSGSERPVAITLDKSIPAAAGLGGGSADAAASLGVAGRMFAVAREDLLQVAAELGSDVPFAFVGGTAEVAGTGSVVSGRALPTGFALGVVVPPAELATGQVFSRWDEMDGPSGPAIAGSDLPPALRGDGPLGNDLYAAAASLAPTVDDWRSELARRWDRPVAMSGSGAALFAYFLDVAEAEAAINEAPSGARATMAAAPVGFGWAAAAAAESYWSAATLGDTELATIRGLVTSAGSHRQ